MRSEDSIKAPSLDPTPLTTKRTIIFVGSLEIVGGTYTNHGFGSQWWASNLGMSLCPRWQGSWGAWACRWFQTSMLTMSRFGSWGCVTLPTSAGLGLGCCGADCCGQRAASPGYPSARTWEFAPTLLKRGRRPCQELKASATVLQSKLPSNFSRSGLQGIRFQLPSVVLQGSLPFLSA